MIDICKASQILSDSATVLMIDLREDQFLENKFTSEFTLTALRDGMFGGFAAWFDCNLTESVVLSTSPLSPPTHWKQTIMNLDQQIPL